MSGKIKNKVRFRVQSNAAWQGEIKVLHLLPNEFAKAIGPIVFLEHVLSSRQSFSKSLEGVLGGGSRPHRGVATLTYILAGEVEHADSLGNHEKLSAGGAHWMKAGNGVLRDEGVQPEFQSTAPDLSIVKLWINLPSHLKSEAPEYFSISPVEIGRQELDDNAGWIKILAGEYKNCIAKVPSSSNEFLFHICLQAGKQFSITTDQRLEYAAFLPASSAIANDVEFQGGEVLAFTPLGELIEISNVRNTAIDIILFGGEPYNEPIVTEENFVMNTPHEITQAYNDYYDGKYGQINT
ncbi:pirin family protein [Chryseolinea soli]|uniref:Pirin family protein n=2 Tax=Chryseolinea soli TaxID=2321403 RepID=A0A385SXU7_9BACT|nr:pirin family protein [Chryseolinea soli]